MAFIVNCLSCGTVIARTANWIDSERREQGRCVELGSLVLCTNCKAVYEVVLSERRPPTRVDAPVNVNT